MIKLTITENFLVPKLHKMESFLGPKLHTLSLRAVNVSHLLLLPKRQIAGIGVILLIGLDLMLLFNRFSVS